MLFKTQSSIRGRFAKHLKAIKRQGAKYEPVHIEKCIQIADLELGKSSRRTQLTEVQKVELFALTKILTSWTELESEYLYRGYQMVPAPGDLLLVTVGTPQTTICSMSDLGFGAEFASMKRRFGSPPEHLTPLDGGHLR